MSPTYTDDISAIVGGKCLATLGSMPNQTLRTINNLIISAGLKVNTNKTDLVLFITKFQLGSSQSWERTLYSTNLASCREDSMWRNE